MKNEERGVCSSPLGHDEAGRGVYGKGGDKASGGDAMQLRQVSSQRGQ